MTGAGRPHSRASTKGFGAFAALWLRKWVMGLYLPAYRIAIENDVYSQIGLVMLIGLAAKNSILIAAFAKAEYENGKPLVEAAWTRRGFGCDRSS